MLKAGIIGATGYGGAELFRLLQRHPQVEVVALASRSNVDSPYWEVYPHFYGHTDLVLQEIDLPNLFAQCDLIFTALPHGHAMPAAQEAIRQGKKLIDLGADFRFDQISTYEQWYKVEHTAPELNSQAVYGLPELFRSQIPDAQILANPGCYPTASALALAPLAKNNLIDLHNIVIDAKSGVSGAGRSLSLNSHYCEANDSIKAYGASGHRHTPEIEQTLGRLAGQEVRLSFTPHLTPMTRGIL
ncbi:MAG: N-acetyl-gamma-glutamyl-phosphate reductase, partial [Clostridia bacterium]|nr:N-acetyl-gamma-glutamyl-phosphate reductase [Clostridia bacterium]